MTKNKIIILFIGFIIAISLGGCTKNSKVEDSVSLLENFEKLVYDQQANRYDIKEYVNKNISNLNNIEMSSSMINTFIYSLYENVEIYTSILYSLHGDLGELENKIDVKSIDASILNKIPNNYKLVKAFLEELDDNFLILEKSNNSYRVDVDMNRIKKEFNSYIDEDTSNYLNFRIKENSLDVYNINSDEYDISLLLDITNTICTNLENIKGDSQKQNWIQHFYYYLEVIFSKSQDTFLGDDNKVILEKFNQLKKESKKYNNTNFGKMMNKYISLLEKNDYNIDSEEVNNFVEEVYNQLDKFISDDK